MPENITNTELTALHEYWLSHIEPEHSSDPIGVISPDLVKLRKFRIDNLPSSAFVKLKYARYIYFTVVYLSVIIPVVLYYARANGFLLPAICFCLFGVFLNWFLIPVQTKSICIGNDGLWMDKKFVRWSDIVDCRLFLVWHRPYLNTLHVLTVSEGSLMFRIGMFASIDLRIYLWHYGADKILANRIGKGWA